MDGEGMTMRELETARFGNLFATPMLSHIWADSAELNAQLRDCILDQARRHPGAARTNMGGWHSEPGLLEFCGEVGARLIDRMDAMVKEATLRLYAEFGHPPQRASWTLSAWANVNRRGDHNQLHTHPGATWSGVYYIDHGEADLTDQATAIHLYDPNPARANLFFPELSTSNIVFRPEPGLMILFPSYVPHEVPPHRGERERISIAFNVRREPFP
jgi:uncharacterized protein (TIGR02466 family)